MAINRRDFLKTAGLAGSAALLGSGLRLDALEPFPDVDPLAAYPTRDWEKVYREQFLAPRRLESLALLQRGIDRGEIRPDVDIDLALESLHMWVVRNVISQRALL